MTTPIFLRLFVAFLLIIWFPFSTLAKGKAVFPVQTHIANFQENKQEKDKETKKPVKEVPQSRKQDKPREVKPESKPKKG